jgi:hypothetical protein
VIPLAAVECTGTKKTLLETDALNHKDTGPRARAFQQALCRREPLYFHDALDFRKDIPFLRFLEISKRGEVVKIVIVFH